MTLLKKAKDKLFWNALRTQPDFAPCVDEIKRVYESSKTLPLPPVTKELRALFDTTGSRKEFEAVYFPRRRFLTTAALLALIYPDEPHYLQETELLLQATSEEFSWALPAHTSGMSEEETKTFIDLFSAETALCVSEICYLLKDRFNPEIKEQAEREVHRRVIDSFLRRTFWWETDKSNWAAVCAGNVCGTFLYLAPDLYETIAPRIRSAINCFLASFTEEGVCLEGFSYWHYGFGEFVWFADLLNEFTDGREDYFKLPKVEKVAEYILKCFLSGNATVSYSDGVRRGKTDVALMSYLSARYPKRFHALPKEVTAFPTGNGDWLQLSRLCLNYNPALENGSLPHEDCFMPEAGQAVLRRKKYSLAVKAGHNGEPHNHNDVGNFILATDRGQVIADLGAGLYTKQYFQNETRYDILCNSSRGHSVPIVNGAFERAGREYCGSICFSGREIAVEFAKAYSQKTLEKLERRFALEEDKVTLTDSFSPENEITERFILLSPPKIEEDCVRVENVVIRFDCNAVSPSVSVEKHAMHEAENGKEEETVYLLDFKVKKGVPSVRFVFEIAAPSF